MSENALLIYDEQRLINKTSDDKLPVPNIQRFLEAEGVAVTLVASGAEALKVLITTTNPFRLVLLDNGVQDMWDFRAQFYLMHRDHKQRPALIELCPPGDSVMCPPTTEELLLQYGVQQSDLCADRILMRLCHPVELRVCIKHALKWSEE